MTDYQRRVRLTLTAAEAEALGMAISEVMAGELDETTGWSSREVAGLQRACSKLYFAIGVAARRNAEKAATKAAKDV